MFEQTFIEFKGNKNRYTVLLSLLIQLTALTALILVPLIYTQVLPKAQLKSIFATPTPPPPTVPKPQEPMAGSIARKVFTMDAITRQFQVSTKVETPDTTAAPVIGDVTIPSDPDSTGMPLGIVPAKPLETPPTPSKNTDAKPVHITSMESSQLIRKVQPTYPEIARSTHIQGTVEFTATISKTGSIEHLQFVRGHPMLVKAAEDAILQWKYKPTLLNGEPVEVITDIIVNFTLSQ